MKQVIILDYSTGKAIIYSVPEETVVTESFISKLGYKLSNVSYMESLTSIEFK